jgi:hypothetical protein
MTGRIPPWVASVDSGNVGETAEDRAGPPGLPPGASGIPLGLSGKSGREILQIERIPEAAQDAVCLTEASESATGEDRHRGDLQAEHEQLAANGPFVSNACSGEPGEVPDIEVNAHLGNPG